jgi:hypothetical protein
VKWTPVLRQTVKTRNSANGELRHGIVSQAVHEGVQTGRGAVAGAGGIRRAPPGNQVDGPARVCIAAFTFSGLRSCTATRAPCRAKGADGQLLSAVRVEPTLCCVQVRGIGRLVKLSLNHRFVAATRATQVIVVNYVVGRFLKFQQSGPLKARPVWLGRSDLLSFRQVIYL